MGRYDVALGREYESGNDATSVTDSTGFYLPREWRQDSTGVVQGEPARPTDADQGLTGPGWSAGETGMGLRGYAGVTGLSGVTGMQGVTGMFGTTGLSGYTGFSGIRGETGIELPPAGSTGINFQMMTVSEALGINTNNIIDMDYLDRPANPGFIQRNSNWDRARLSRPRAPAGHVEGGALEHVCPHCGQPLKKILFFFHSKGCVNSTCENWDGNRNHRHEDRYSMALSRAYTK